MNPLAHLSTLALLVLAALPVAMASEAPSDPTRPPSAVEIQAFFGQFSDPGPPERRWQLQSVLLSDQRRVAIINGRRVSEGDRFEQAEVIRIEPGRVVLERNGERFVLTIISRRYSGGDPL